jgi:non-specific serine/threonine protein kinase
VDVQLEQVGAALPSYEIGEELGRGSTGVVVAARHRQLGRDVAVKLLPPDLATNPQVRRRFVAEAKLLASFSHVHIVPVYDFVEDEGLCLLVMERLVGGTLDAHARAGLDAPAGCAAVLAICSALQYAHERDVLHRDVKPANVLIAEDGLVKMTDFGIAKVLGGSETVVTRSGFVLGTPAYMAPEQASGTDPGPATDVYGAGTVLYELLAGRLPFPPESNPLQMLYSHVHSEPQPLRETAPDVPAKLADVVMRALERDPAERYACARDLGVAVAAAAASAWGPDWVAATPFGVAAPGPMVSARNGPVPPTLPPTVAEPPPGGTGSPPPSSTVSPSPGGRRRLGLVLAGALVLLALAAGAVALLAGGDEPDSDRNGDIAASPAPDTQPASEWRQLQSAGTARQQAPAVVLSGTAWVLGGLQDGPGGTPVALRSVEAFDTTIGQWKTGPQLPIPLHHAMAAAYRNQVVVMGGWIPEGSNLSGISSNRVFTLRGERWVELPRMRSPRVAGAAAAVGDRIVAVGGQAHDRLVPSTEIFDGKTWKPGDDIPTPREHLAAASDGRFLYAAGGRNLDAGKNSAAFERYDPAEDSWEKLPDMPQALGGLGAAFVDGQIVAIGGETSTAVLGTTLVYDISKKRWTKAAPLRTPRHGMSVVAFGDTVYALDGATAAGHTNSTPIAEALSFEPRKKK